MSEQKKDINLIKSIRLTVVRSLWKDLRRWGGGCSHSWPSVRKYCPACIHNTFAWKATVHQYRHHRRLDHSTEDTVTLTSGQHDWFHFSKVIQNVLILRGRCVKTHTCQNATAARSKQTSAQRLTCDNLPLGFIQVTGNHVPHSRWISQTQTDSTGLQKVLKTKRLRSCGKRLGSSSTWVGAAGWRRAVWLHSGRRGAEKTRKLAAKQTDGLFLGGTHPL